MPPNEVEKFFQGLPSQDNQQPADIFGDGPAKTPPEEGTPGAAPVIPAEGEDGAEPHKNRRHRRWEQRLSERERQLELEAARLEGVREARAAAAENPDIDPRLVQLYGAENTPAAKLHMELLNDFAKKAKEDAFEEMRQRQAQEAKDEAQLESFIDSELESIEDEYGVDLTSNSPAARKTRFEFLSLVEKLSPKDSEGKPSDFADFDQTWEIYQNYKKSAAGSNERAKDIASRSMESAGTGATPPKVPTPGFEGWKKDLGLSN